MNIGIIFAGGVGHRCGLTDRPKQFIEINGKPVIIHTLEHFELCSAIDKVVVACLEDWIDYLQGLVTNYRLNKVAAIVPGGNTSQMSIYNALVEAKRISGDNDSIVLIHDGVRPLINEQLLIDNIDAVKEYGSAITCSRVTETPIRVDDNNVVDAFKRDYARVAKAPQSFLLSDILEAHEDAKKKGKMDYVDSCSLMMEYKSVLHYVECSVDNIKVTEMEDIYLLRAIFRARDDIKNFSKGDID